MTTRTVISILALISGFSLILEPAAVPFGLMTAAQAQEVSPPTPKTPEPVVPALENPVTSLLESGKIIVTVAATRRFKDGASINYGYRTGQIIPVTIVISTDPDVILDTGALSSKTLSKAGSDFEMVTPPVVSTLERHGKKITILQVLVRTWVMDPSVTLSAQFHYALNYLPDKKTPAWKVGSTPDFVISTSRTATESSKQLLDGDTSNKQSTPRPSVSLLKYAGILLALGGALWYARRLWIEWRRAKSLTDAQRAWQAIDPALLERATTDSALTVSQLETICAALRSYLQIDTVPTRDAHAPLSSFFGANAQSETLITMSFSALAKLDRAIYGKVPLTREEEEALLTELERIIPRT